MSWPERNGGPGNNLLLGIQHDLKMPGQAGQDADGFDQGQLLADAHPRPAAKGEVRVTRQRGSSALEPALRHELRWPVEESRVAMDKPLAQDNAGAPANPVTGHGGVTKRLATERPNG